VSSLHHSHNNPNGDGTLPHLNGRLSLHPSHNGDRVLPLNRHPHRNLPLKHPAPFAAASVCKSQS
jgi:hypothetical protein